MSWIELDHSGCQQDFLLFENKVSLEYLQGSICKNNFREFHKLHSSLEKIFDFIISKSSELFHFDLKQLKIRLKQEESSSVVYFYYALLSNIILVQHAHL